MNTRENEQLLKSFFSGYFHEDWMGDAASAAEVVNLYRLAAKPEEIANLSEAIVLYIERVGSEMELEKKLFSELGCYYRPSADGLSSRGWLTNISDLLKSGRAEN